MQFCTCVGSADSEEKTSGTSCQILSKMKQGSCWPSSKLYNGFTKYIYWQQWWYLHVVNEPCHPDLCMQSITIRSVWSSSFVTSLHRRMSICLITMPYPTSSNNLNHLSTNHCSTFTSILPKRTTKNNYHRHSLCLIKQHSVVLFCSNSRKSCWFMVIARGV